jgi:type I restriction-modification system DNA methylase subunit
MFKNENKTNTDISNKNNNNFNDNKEITNNKNKKIEISNNISNKEALKDKIHEIHNYLRNNGVGYGMNALKVFNLLYCLKKIEEQNLLDKVKLKRPDCEFSYLLKIANENKDEELEILIHKNILDSINKSLIKKLLFYEIPKTITGKSLSYLIKEIDKITIIEKTCNVLLSGKIYEYFIGRDDTAISELGAYFTDRHIVNYIYKKLDPKINEDGTINTMIDMFGGSGGFTTGYINFLNDKYKDIDWKNNINKIYHFDMNEDVIKSAGLEFLCLTGILPNMNDNLKYKNSFTDEFDEKKFMNVITNPPYGGDKIYQTNTQIKIKKIKEYIKKELETLKDDLIIETRLKQLKKIEEQEKKYSEKIKISINTCSQRINKYAKDNKLIGNDKESASLILIMDLVEENGTAIGVFKEGIFFNKIYKDIRKCLIEKFNVREIISIPQDQFENTTTKTSIIIFNNTKEKTSKVKFLNLNIKKYTEDKFEEINNEIVLTENKDDICEISDIMVSEATKDEILKNPLCSLNGKDYDKKEIVCGKDYELKKLDVICDIKFGTRIIKKNSTDGSIPVYGGGDITFYTNTNNRNENTLIVSRYAMSKECVRIIPKKFYLNDSGLSIHAKDEKLQNYINYYLLTDANQKYIYENCTTGSIQKNINMTMLKNMLIPIPKSQQKTTEWVNKISLLYDKKNKNEELLIKLEEQIKNNIKDIEKNEDCNEVELSSLIDSKITPKFIINTNELDNNGIYPFYNKAGEPLGYHSKYNYDLEKCILITKDGGSGTKIYGNNIALGSVKIIKGKFVSTCSNFILKINESINLNYIYCILKNMKNQIMDLANYSVKIGHIQYYKLIKLKIKLPKNEKIINNIDKIFQKIEKLQTEIKEINTQYKKLIKELSEEAMPKK